MSPFESCEAEFHRRHPESAFWKEVLYYARHGVVHATPDYCVLARRVPHNATDIQVKNMAYLFPEEECDAWFFAWFAGDMAKVWQADVDWLDWIMYEREHGGVLELNQTKTEVMRRLTTS